ncbi:Sensor protein ZraS [bacterium HR17]|uniref:histidine kinase n=1 Tax=Candidatus Fervidibacter japonicus TaxID=2035412 RepID=A0A2H5XEH8_9BACT|nr:Sensor protein ZraS [bacterium HR17]
MASQPLAQSHNEEVALQRAYRFLSALPDTEALLRATLEEALEAVQATRGTIALMDYRTGELVIRVAVGTGWTEEHIGLRLKVTDEPGGSISGYVAATGQPYTCGDVTKDPHYYPLFADTRSELAVPLIGRGHKVLGVLNVESEKPNAFTDQDTRILTALASVASFALSAADYHNRERALIELGKELAAATEIETLLERVAEVAAQVLDADDCSLFLLDKSLNQLVLQASRGLLRQFVGQASYRVGEGLTGWVALHGKPIRTDGVVSDPRWKGLYTELLPEEISAFMAVPIRGRNGVLGVLRVVRRRSSPLAPHYLFTEEDEELLSMLASQVGAALERAELQERLFTMEHIAAVGELAARIAHMIGNKIFALKGALKEVLLRLEAVRLPEDVRRIFQSMERNLFEVETLLQELRDFVKATQLNLQPLCLSDLVRELVQETAQRLPHLQFELRLDEQPVWVRGDPEKLRSVVEELLENASHFLKEGDTVVLHLSVDQWFSGRKIARLIVQDSGPGVPERLKEQIFQPFFSTRAKGMGLGLAIVKGIIEAHGGTIEERGREGEGAKFIITLPVIDPPSKGGTR